MRNLVYIFILIVLVAVIFKTNAQIIPNGGFEDWATVGGIEYPTGVWLTTNSFSTGSFLPVTKSTDHYPLDSGNFSVKIENDTSISKLKPPAGLGGYGMIMTTKSFLLSRQHGFPITGHPTCFKGYYKFTPQNNDTLLIAILLFKNGNPVSDTILLTGTSPVPNWTSFKLPLQYSTDPDSAFIELAAFYSFPKKFPHGNSILYVDNLSFDLRDYVTENIQQNNLFNLYPNPTSDFINIDISKEMFRKLNMTNWKAEIYDVLGNLIYSENTIGKFEIKINVSYLNDGVYIMKLQNSEQITAKKIIVKH